MARQKENTVRLNVYVTQDDYECLCKIAEDTGSNISLMVRTWIKEKLKESTNKE